MKNEFFVAKKQEMQYKNKRMQENTAKKKNSFQMKN